MKSAASPAAVTEDYFANVKRLLDLVETVSVESLIDTIYKAYTEDRTIFIIGNGGSASNASHLGQDLSKGTVDEAAAIRRIRALSLTDNLSYITAVANDEGYEFVFARQLATLARTGDLVVAISCSGNSSNVLQAIEQAKHQGLKTLAVTGFSGGRLAAMVDVHVNVPSDDFGLVEAIHAVLFHLTVFELRKRIRSS